MLHHARHTHLAGAITTGFLAYPGILAYRIISCTASPDASRIRLSPNNHKISVVYKLTRAVDAWPTRTLTLRREASLKGAFASNINIQFFDVQVYYVRGPREAKACRQADRPVRS